MTMMYIFTTQISMTVMFTGSDDGAWELYLSIIIYITFGKFGKYSTPKHGK